MLSELDERFVLAVEHIAAALEGLHVTRQKEFERQFPDPQRFREAVVTRVPTEEERIREAQGSSANTIEEWLGELDEEEVIGLREREFLERSAQTSKTEETSSGSVGTPENPA
jgi:hypothetical protein